MKLLQVVLLAGLLLGGAVDQAAPAVAQQFTFPIDLVATGGGWESPEYPIELPARGTYDATVTFDFVLTADPPPDSETELKYTLFADPAPPPCPPGDRLCLSPWGLCYPCPDNLKKILLGRSRHQTELSSRYIQDNGRSWKVYLWTISYGGEPGARLTGSLTVTVQALPVQPDPEITVTRPPDQWLVPADRRLDVAWTRVGLMALTVHVDLLDSRGRQAARLAKGTANDGQEAVTIPRAVAAGSYRVRVETVDGKVKGDSGVIHVPPA